MHMEPDEPAAPAGQSHGADGGEVAHAQIPDILGDKGRFQGFGRLGDHDPFDGIQRQPVESVTKRTGPIPGSFLHPAVSPLDFAPHGTAEYRSIPAVLIDDLLIERFGCSVSSRRT